MGFRKFVIVFDDPRNIYYPGQVVTGRVQLELNNSETVRSVNIVVKGGAKTRWSKHVERLDEDTLHTFGTEEKYFTRQYYLLGSAFGDRIELPAGKHAYPFSCPLPYLLPSSFEANAGHVRYTIEAIIDQPREYHHKTKAVLTVISLFDLNQEPQAFEPVQQQMSKTFCSFKCSSSPLTVNVSLPVRGYVSGQEIPVTINVDNKSRIAVEKIKVTLLKDVIFHGEERMWIHEKTRIKKKSSVIGEVSTGPVGGVAVTEYVQKLNVPPLTLSNLKYCNIIDLEYRLQVETCMSSWFRRNLKESFLLHIGDVPLTAHAMSTTSGTPCTHENKMNSNAFEFVTTPSASMTSPTSCIGFDLPPPSYEEAMIRAGNL